MDYEQEYKKAFEAAKGLHDAGNARTKKQMEIVFPQLAESEDEKIRKFLIDYFTSYKIGNVATKLNGYRIDDILAYLEKQKEHKSVQSDAEKEYVRTLKSLVSDFVRANNYIERGYYQQIYDWLDGRHIEQKPAERQDYSGLTDLERAIHHGFLSAGVENVPVTIIKETAQECLAQMKSAEWDELQSEFKNINKAFKDGKKDVVAHPERYGLCKPAEWSEEDEDMLNSCISSIEEAKENRYAYKETDGDTSYDHEIAWLKSLRPQPLWKPSEEQMEALLWCIAHLGGADHRTLAELYEHLKQL